MVLPVLNPPNNLSPIFYGNVYPNPALFPDVLNIPKYLCHVFLYPLSTFVVICYQLKSAVHFKMIKGAGDKFHPNFPATIGGLETIASNTSPSPWFVEITLPYICFDIAILCIDLCKLTALLFISDMNRSIEGFSFFKIIPIAP